MKNNWELPHILTVKSSAGAGKTYRLALRYLQLLAIDKFIESPVKNHISNIVAITFTNKAAAEMRLRIIDWMKRIILDIPFEHSSRKPIDEILSSEEMRGQGVNPAKAGLESLRNDIIETIKNNFEDLIRNFYDFKVGTIDSFVNLTLKASAFKLNLPPDFDISTESSLYIDLVLQECLQQILEDKTVREKFDRFLKNYIEMEGENVSWIPKIFLRDTIYNFWKEEAKENKEFAYTINIDRLELVRKQIKKDFKVLSHYLKTMSQIKVNKNFLKALTEFSISNRLEFKGSSYFKKQTIKECLNKGSALPNEEHEKLWQEIRQLLARFTEAISEFKFSSYIEIYNLFKQMLKKEITYRRRLILIEQLNKLLQQIINREHFIPEIYYALAEQYFHFLIDEFQDTNHLQWKNIEVLVEEALSRGGALFLVGDKKQAIYRWRGGKPELVDEVARTYQSYPVYRLNLGTNYRSGEHIVTFNNTIFSPPNLNNIIESMMKDIFPKSRGEIIETYQDSTQSCLESKKDEGHVYIEKLIQKDDEGKTKETFVKEEKNQITGERFKKLIMEIKNSNVFQDKDIAILTRRREEAQFIVKILLEMGISVDSEFTVNVKNNPLIKEMISFLQFINTPGDDMSFAGFITGKIFLNKTEIIGDEIIQWITDNRINNTPHHLYKMFQKDYPHLWDTYFEYFFKSTGYLPLYELVVLFLKRWGILKHFSEDAPYFLHVCELIKERESLGGNNLTGFLRFWNEGSGNLYGDSPETEAPFLLKTTEGVNAVKVLTIHKAKGLQFPIVILPFLKLNTFGASDSRDKAKFYVSEKDILKLLYIKKDFTDYSENLKNIYQEKEAEYLFDELNNTYVACTRAEKELYIFLADSERQKNHLIDYLFNIDDLKKYVKDNTIEIGKRSSLFMEHRIGDEENILFFDNIGDDIKWIEKIKTKFEEPEKISKNQIFAKKKGDVIHYILSMVKELPDDHEEFLNTCITTGIAKYGFHPYEEEIKNTIIKFFHHPEFKKFFLPEKGDIVYTEKEIIDRKGETYKIDRIIIHSDHVDVIDFKTGESHAIEHGEQITNYASLLQKIHQGKSIKKYLLYIDDNRIIAP